LLHPLFVAALDDSFLCRTFCFRLLVPTCDLLPPYYMPEDGFTGGIGVGEEADGGEEGQEYDEHDYDAAAHEPGRDFADQAAHFFRTEVDVGGHGSKKSEVVSWRVRCRVRAGF